jgi:GrpB-like predicted nucleotidyltransferase (UPF0157 family)
MLSGIVDVRPTMNKVNVTVYNPNWVSQFESLYKEIWPHISDVSLSLEHVGSTSVPGLSAKPTIDLTIVVPNKTSMKTVIARLSSLGIKHKGSLGIKGRESFTRLKNFTKHNLYACVIGEQALRNHLTVRDSLRENPALSKEYGELKFELARKFPNDIDSYVEGKSTFLLAILRNQGFVSRDIKEIEEANRNPGNLSIK